MSLSHNMHTYKYMYIVLNWHTIKIENFGLAQALCVYAEVDPKGTEVTKGST